MSGFVNPGTLWDGRTVVCLGSGDTLRCMDWRDVERMRLFNNAYLLAINSSIKTMRHAGVEPDALIFSDDRWFDANCDLVAGFKGRVFTDRLRPKVALPDKIERIDFANRPDFAVGRPPARNGRSTGHRAIGLAIMLGATRVVLLGYDMRVDPDTGRSHCHDDYQHTEPASAYADEFIPGFAGWNADAQAVGVQALNATPGSALKEFPMVTLAEVLR